MLEVLLPLIKELDIPMVYGGIYRFEGQVSVFNVNGSPGYVELFPDTPSGHHNHILYFVLPLYKSFTRTSNNSINS